MNSLALPPDFASRVLRNEMMAKHTSWHVGGPADLFFRPLDVADLAAFLQSLEPDTPVMWIGLGSNLLVRDGGVRGAVIDTHGVFSELELIRSGAGEGTASGMADGVVRDAGQRTGNAAGAAGLETASEASTNVQDVWAGAGVACAKLAKQCVKWGLGPAEFFAGIPGTLGGALAMNAGAFGGETWQHVVAVATLDRAGVRHERPAQQFEVGYRHVVGPANEWFLGARLRFEKCPGVSSEDIRSLLARRKATQPIGEWSCGSVFTNPPGDHAARLIDSAGLKGLRIGGARVSQVHANFIVNDGTASAADIENLIAHVQQTVAQVHGVQLKPEVRIVGEVSTRS